MLELLLPNPLCLRHLPSLHHRRNHWTSPAGHTAQLSRLHAGHSAPGTSLRKSWRAANATHAGHTSDIWRKALHTRNLTTAAATTHGGLSLSHCLGISHAVH